MRTSEGGPPGAINWRGGPSAAAGTFSQEGSEERRAFSAASACSTASMSPPTATAMILMPRAGCLILELTPENVTVTLVVRIDKHCNKLVVRFQNAFAASLQDVH